MAAILDNYVQSQIIAVQAQLNLNAAQQENEKIMATLKAQTAAMVAEWDKFVKIQGDHGPMAALTGMATALKNLLSLMNAPGINILVALLGAGVLATGAKMAITGIGMNMAKTELSGMKGGLAASTLRALSGDLAAAGLIATNVAEGGFLKMVTQLDRIGMSSLVAQRGMVDFTSTMKAAGIAFAVFSDIVLPLAILAEGMSLFNTASTYFNHPAPNISQVDAYGGQAGAARDRAALDDTVASVLADPNVPQSRKDTLLKSMSGLGVGASNIRQDAAANRRLASIYSDAQIKEQQRVTEEYQQDLAQHTGWANKGSLWHWKSTGAEKMLEDQKNIAESQGKTLEMQRAQLEADAPMGPGYAGTEIAKGTPGARIAALSSAIGGIYGTMGTGSPLADHHRKLAELQSDRDMKKSAFDQINAASGYPKDASTLEGSINKAAWTAAQQAYIQAGTAYNAESGYASEGLSRKQTMLGGQARYAKADFSSLATGHTEGERMAHQDKEGANLAAFYRSHQEIAGALQIEVELTENKLKAQEKILELDKEIKNTQIEINREYARSLLTSSPSQLLEKLAVGQLSRGGRMSAGSFFSMTTSAREDYLKMPGHTEQERVLNRSRNALVNQFGRGNASSIGQAMLNGAPSQGAYHRLFGEMHAPDLGLIQSLAVTATNVHIVAQTVTVSGPAAPTPQGPSNGFNNPKFLPSTHSALSNVVGGGRVQDTRPPWAGGPTSYPPF
jgi:hypothetical protein